MVRLVADITGNESDMANVEDVVDGMRQTLPQVLSLGKIPKYSSRINPQHTSMNKYI